LIHTDWNFIELYVVQKLAELVETKRKEHVDALLLKHLEELMQEYDGIIMHSNLLDPKTIELNIKLEEASEEMKQLFPNLEAEVLLNC
jgi:hypothetical protein